MLRLFFLFIVQKVKYIQTLYLYFIIILMYPVKEKVNCLELEVYV